MFSWKSGQQVTESSKVELRPKDGSCRRHRSLDAGPLGAESYCLGVKRGPQSSAPTGTRKNILPKPRSAPLGADGMEAVGSAGLGPAAALVGRNPEHVGQRNHAVIRRSEPAVVADLPVPDRLDLRIGRIAALQQDNSAVAISSVIAAGCEHFDDVTEGVGPAQICGVALSLLPLSVAQSV